MYLKATRLALKCLYSSDHAPDIERSTLKLLLKLAVTNVHFKYNKKWYCQVDGLAMGAFWRSYWQTIELNRSKIN